MNVNGADADVGVVMRGIDVVRALVGLAGACQNGEVTHDTYRVIVDALDSVYMGAADEEATVEAVHREKFAVSPGCATCAAPCGNTSDCGAEKLTADTAESSSKRALAGALAAAAHAVKLRGADVTSGEGGMFVRALSYIGYDVGADVIGEVMRDVENMTEKF